MDAVTVLFNTVLVVFVASTMLGAGLGTTTAALAGVLKNVPLVALVLLVNLVVVPLLGWGIAEVLSLGTAGYVALVLACSSPGGPFGAKLAMTQRGDLVTGSALQVLLAAIGSLTFLRNRFQRVLVIKRSELGTPLTLPILVNVKAGEDRGSLAAGPFRCRARGSSLVARNGGRMAAIGDQGIEPDVLRAARGGVARQLAADHRPARVGDPSGGRARDRACHCCRGTDGDRGT